ncbi:leucine-rich repeat domain-containing protein [Leptolyngbya sp. FACHB-541]|uniref:leucine-rich repeat domain-containing protein n=1 Tax=Leptolyngbya sp. FACHB-541 TaxID=2692810 RepID=UPI0016831616|nr:COR domain-containing protein [Leptolyngbya sp. FACHB-541]MBD1996457.1 leucine-rich repeat domain-containing protein [Leptolyngbya sp. FACHB-541]
MARDEAYREAEQSIEAARQEGATELDLSGMGLTELPEAIASLTLLRSLDLSNNQSMELPEAIASLTQLQSLNLFHNQLTELPEAIASLTQLQSLDLSNNQLMELPEAIAALTQLQELNLSRNQLTELPEAISSLTQLQELNLSGNQLTELPEAISSLTQLQKLYLQRNQLVQLPEILDNFSQLQELLIFGNKLSCLPDSIVKLNNLQVLRMGENPFGRSLDNLQWKLMIRLQEVQIDDIGLEIMPSWLNDLPALRMLFVDANQLTELLIPPDKFSNLETLSLGGSFLQGGNPLEELPEEIGSLNKLKNLSVGYCQLTDLPASVAQLKHLEELDLRINPLNPDIAAAYEQGIEAVMQYLRARVEGEVTLNEAKLILVGEGEVGKSCLLGALRGDEWVDGRPTTHGIEIKPMIVTSPDNRTEITLNGWDFGGQRVYRPTHQLFFSSSAVYLVVWKPREGPQQGFVKEWITLIKHREPDAKVLVVATHGGPGQRQPDIDRQELIDLFGNNTIIDFFHVDSLLGTGITELREAIAKIAATLPGMGRSVPTKWQRIRELLENSGKTHLPYKDAIALCEEQGLEGFAAELFVRVSHTLGYLIHYHYDPILRDIVILKPDWLAKAISFVMDDKNIRRRNGLVEFNYLSQIWSDPPFEGETGYPKALHPVFLRLMEHFDLSYKVVLDPASREESTTSLIAQLVPDNRPEQLPNWGEQPEEGDRQQMQICRIADDRGQGANAEGLFYQLIVRLHKYSLGRTNYENSVHWQRGLMLDNDYNGRALLEYIGNDIKITVRAAYPERFLSYLTEEIRWLVENPKNPFGWKGLRCNVMVPCLEPCGMKDPGYGLFEVQKLIESKKKNRPDYPCPISGCDEWHNIDCLLSNAPAAQPDVQEMLSEKLTDVQATLQVIRKELRSKDRLDHRRYQDLSQKQLATLSKVDQQFAYLMKMLTDEAKDGPRLFSFKPVDPGFFDRPKWISEKFQLTLWCEHSRKPLPSLNPAGSKQGVYELELNREWFTKAAPYFKLLTGTLSLVLPVAASTTQFMLDDATYKGIQEELDLGQKSLEFGIKSSDMAIDWQSKRDSPDLERGEAIRAQGSMLRELHTMLKEKDPGFGGLVRVQNKRREFLWVHSNFVDEY